MRPSVLIAIVLEWIGSGLIAGAANNASFRAEFGRLYQSPYYARQAYVRSMTWGVAGGPFALGIIAIETRWFSTGFSLEDTAFPCLPTSDPDIWCKP